MEKNSIRVRRNYTTADKKRLLQEFQTSGQTIKEWCQQNSIGLSTLQRWLRTTDKNRPENTVPTWVPVVAVTQEVKSNLVVEAGVFSIMVSTDTDRGLLADVLVAVKSVC